MKSFLVPVFPWPSGLTMHFPLFRFKDSPSLPQVAFPCPPFVKWLPPGSFCVCTFFSSFFYVVVPFFQERRTRWLLVPFAF